MPLYEYQCDKCGTTFEVLQKFSDAPLEVHQDCGGKVVRLISAPGLQFKGTGWYVTDYARNSGGSQKEKDGEGKSEGKGEAKPESKSDTKTESKPAPAKTESKPA